jgi:hypothetical protein
LLVGRRKMESIVEKAQNVIATLKIITEVMPLQLGADDHSSTSRVIPS